MENFYLGCLVGALLLGLLLAIGSGRRRHGYQPTGSHKPVNPPRGGSAVSTPKR